ncbi:Predicted PurR-regulated permease PerM [Catalinimonas alkaloidigena]|uniref:Predicted PurR-regulated permease PerM n=1 Tax=Catalinimonas alkaloidigena TaxID=1075417 RepID=A0A1G8WES1_9BACT|nr:AI-2E family transporter [Catalinimonas alkaloidigena]SDJ76195.1 Predicted PurR-regulated permease PerM [Catalinimonas alkaloidigena]
MLNRLTLQLLLIVLAIIFLGWIFSSLLFYFLISLILATLLKPLTDMVHNVQIYGMRVPRALAVVTSFMLLASILTLFVLMFIPLVQAQIKVISNIDLDDLLYSLEGPISELEEFFLRNNLTNQEKGFLLESLQKNTLTLFSSINFNNLINNLLWFTGSFFVTLLALVFITFFLLYEKGILKRLFLRAVPNAYFELVIAALHKIETLLSNYLTGLLLQMFSVFTLVSLGLTIVGVKYVPTIAIFAAIANLIPYLGPILGGAFGLFVGISTAPFDLSANEYVWLIAKILAVFATVQLVDNLVLQPVIFSKSVKAHPLEIFVIIFAGAAIAGPVGMIAAIPFYTIIRVSATEFFRGYQQYYIFDRFKEHHRFKFDQFIK